METYEKAVSVRVLRPYVIEVTFADATVQTIDIEPQLWGEVFEPLKDPALFALASVDARMGVVEWPNGADLAPEFAYHGGRIHEDTRSDRITSPGRVIAPSLAHETSAAYFAMTPVV